MSGLISAFSGHCRCAVTHPLPQHSQEEVSTRKSSRDAERRAEVQTSALRKVPNLILAWIDH